MHLTIGINFALHIMYKYKTTSTTYDNSKYYGCTTRAICRLCVEIITNLYDGYNH